MASVRKLKTVTGLKEVDALLDSLVDPKFRKNALRAGAKKAMEPVKDTLISKIPDGAGTDDSSYAHYNDGKGYQSGDLKRGVKLQIKINTDKDIKVKRNGHVKDDQQGELYANVTFKNDVYRLASVLENGRSKRLAKTRNGKVFHAWGNPTDMVQRDIGTTTGKNFVSETFTQHESDITNTFKKELITAIEKQAKKMAKAKSKGK
ncbi:hypothetical protein L4D00_14980 [Photobacterium swingsii]|uniref:hypothetical protein n=1 Tax=Photobacterium swingsii TaxID=680026 RepID=UPI003D127B08